MHDLVPAGQNGFFIVVFSKTNSSVYREAVEVARLAQTYRENTVDGKNRHCAVFNESRDQVEVAMRLTHMTRDWKGTMFFAQGRLITPYGGWSALEVLTCLNTAQRCADWKAHCLTVVDRLEPLDVSAHPQLAATPGQGSVRGRYLFPCALLKMYFALDRGPLSSLADCVQAGAVDRGVEWCPYFSMQNFRPLNSEV